jgi:hypothetical protein
MTSVKSGPGAKPADNPNIVPIVKKCIILICYDHYHT